MRKNETGNQRTRISLVVLHEDIDSNAEFFIECALFISFRWFLQNHQVFFFMAYVATSVVHVVFLLFVRICAETYFILQGAMVYRQRELHRERDKLLLCQPRILELQEVWPFDKH